MHKTSVPLDPVYSVAPYAAGASVVAIVGLGDLLCIAVHHKLPMEAISCVALLCHHLRAIFCGILEPSHTYTEPSSV